MNNEYNQDFNNNNIPQNNNGMMSNNYDYNNMNNNGYMNDNNDKKDNNKMIIIIVGAIVAVVVIIVILYFALFKKSEDTMQYNNGNDNTTNTDINTNNGNSTNNNGNNKKVKTDWRKMEFSINGIKKQLPLTLDELVEGTDLHYSYMKTESGAATYSFSGTGCTNLLAYVNKEIDKVFMFAAYKCKILETSGVTDGMSDEEMEKLIGKPNLGNVYYANGVDDSDGTLSKTPVMEQLDLMDRKHAPTQN